MKYVRTIALAAGLAGFAGFAAEAIAQDNKPSIDAANAKVESNAISNVNVTIDKPGYLVIHDKGKGAPPASLGNIKVEPGTTENVTVKADSELDPANGLSVMLHYETNDNGTYDFGPGKTESDGPVVVDDKVIMEPVGGKM